MTATSRSNLSASQNGGRTYRVPSVIRKGVKPVPLTGDYKDSIIYCYRCAAGRTGDGAVRDEYGIVCVSCNAKDAA